MTEKQATIVIFDRLQFNLDALLLKTERYSDEILNKKPHPEAWSALQTMHHLMSAECGSLKNVIYYDKKGNLKPKVYKNYTRKLILRFAYWLPFKYKAPSVSVEQIPDESDYKSTITEWLQVRKELGQFLQSLPDSSFEQQHYKHPVVGMMTIGGMMDFQDIHFKRHLKQILTAIDK
jgi:hypothetical protein